MNTLTIRDCSTYNQTEIILTDFNITVKELIDFLISEGVLNKIQAFYAYKVLLNGVFLEYENKCLSSYGVKNKDVIDIVTKSTGAIII